MVRRDATGLTHWANPPNPYAYQMGVVTTGAFCDPQLNTYGCMLSVEQRGPTCLWCVAVMKRQS